MAINSSISSFRDNFFGGTRPNRFLVNGNVNGQDLSDEGFLVKSTTLPASTVGVIPVPYRGRILKIPGDRLFAEWAIVVIDDADEGRDLRSEFVGWSNAINTHVGNKTDDPNVSDTLSKNSWTVQMLSQKDDAVIREITLHNVWPIEVSAVDLTYDTADTIVEFGVNLAYDYWTEEGSTDAVSGE